jgi:hypothetical protein
LREVLRFKTDLAYQGIEEGFVASPTGERPQSVGARWNYNQGPPVSATTPSATAPGAPRQNLDAPPGGAQPWLRRAMVVNPSLKAFVAFGLYDSLNSCAVQEALVEALEPEYSRRFVCKSPEMSPHSFRARWRARPAKVTGHRAACRRRPCR